MKIYEFILKYIYVDTTIKYSPNNKMHYVVYMYSIYIISYHKISKYQGGFRKTYLYIRTYEIIQCTSHSCRFIQMYIII